MTQVRDSRNGVVYTLIRMENMFNPLEQKFIVNDNGVERAIPITDGRVI